MSKEQTEKPKAERAPPDPELQAMRRISAILDTLEPQARRRVMGYLADRHSGLDVAMASLPWGIVQTTYEGRPIRKDSAAPPVIPEAK